jgi:ribosomal protein S27AE
VLKKYLKDEELQKEKNVCPECGGEMEMKEGCMACASCGYSKCG